RLPDLAGADRVLQRADDRLLAEHLVEALRAILAVEGGHGAPPRFYAHITAAEPTLKQAARASGRGSEAASSRGEAERALQAARRGRLDGVRGAPRRAHRLPSGERRAPRGTRAAGQASSAAAVATPAIRRRLLRRLGRRASLAVLALRRPQGPRALHVLRQPRRSAGRSASEP